MPIHGYSSTTKAGLVLDGGQFRFAATIISTTRGGVKFDPGEEWDETEFDGRAAAIEGFDRIGFSRAIMTLSILEASSANLLKIMPGAATNTVGGVETITPRAARVFIAAQTSARAIFDRGDGKFLEIIFPKFITKWAGIESADRSEGGFPLTVEARASAVAAEILNATYLVKIHDTSATL